MQSPSNPLVEVCTEVFYMIHKGGVPSIHCEMNLTWSKPMKVTEGLSFILINFNVPVLVPCLNCHRQRGPDKNLVFGR
jgi:hypothetical protein